MPLFMERFSTTVADGDTEKDLLTRWCKVAYGHFIREPLRTYRARRGAAAQRPDGEG